MSDPHRRRAAPWTGEDRPNDSVADVADLLEDAPRGRGASDAESEGDDVDEIARAWLRERPGTPVSSIGVVTRMWRAAKILGDDRRRTLTQLGADSAVLDLLAVLRRSGPPYRLTTRELSRRSLVTPGAISQRLGRAEQDGLVTRAAGPAGSRVVEVTLTDSGHRLVETLVDRVLLREVELLGALDDEEQATLARLLRKLLAGLHDEVAAGGHSQNPRHPHGGET